MFYRKIEKPYLSQPVGYYENFGSENDNLIVDSQGNIFERRGNQFFKLGYTTSLISSLTKYVPAVGVGVVLSNLFFPARSKNNNVSIFMIILGLALGLMFVYGVFIGWLVDVLITNSFDKLVYFLEKNKFMRLFMPHYWFTGNSKVVGYLHLGMPVFLILSIILFMISGGDNSTLSGTLFGLNFFSLVISIVCIVLDLFYNLLAKVVKY